MESALLLGSGLESHCDESWYVCCEHNGEGVNRLVEKEDYSVESLRIISNQPSDERI